MVELPFLLIILFQCENLLEKHEDVIEDWYYNNQDIPLKQFLCIDKALRKGDTSNFLKILLNFIFIY